jgi:DNA-binding transcriptional LysR family regulator
MPVNTMQFRDIEYFAVIAEFGNVRRASESLGLSPPALSKSLRRLEASMQAKLVERSSRGVKLTAVGYALLGRVEQLRLALRDVTREAVDLGRGHAGHLRVGANPVDCEYLPAAFARMLKEAPGVTMAVTVNDIDATLPLLRKGELDVLIVVRPERTIAGFEEEFLWDDEWVVSASKRHRLAARKRVALAELVDEGWALSEATVRPHQLLHRVFAEHGLPPPRVVLESRAVRVKLLAVERTDLLSLGSRRMGAAAGFGLTTLRVKELAMKRPVCAMYRSGGYLPPVARNMIEALKSLGGSRPR